MIRHTVMKGALMVAMAKNKNLMLQCSWEHLGLYQHVCHIILQGLGSCHQCFYQWFSIHALLIPVLFSWEHLGLYQHVCHIILQGLGSCHQCFYQWFSIHALLIPVLFGYLLTYVSVLVCTCRCFK